MQEAPPPPDPNLPPKEERAHELRSEPPTTPRLPVIELPASEPLRSEPIVVPIQTPPVAPPIPVAAGQPAAPPTTPVFGAGVPATPPPPPPRVTEVETTPATASDVRGPVIDVAAQRPTPPPEPRTPPAQGVPPPPVTPASTGASTGQPATPPPPPSAGTPPPPTQSSPLRRYFWAVASHLMLLLVIPTLFLGASITFLIWQLGGRKNTLVEDQGREALNFQINVAGVTALLGLSCVSVSLVPVVWFVAIIMSVIAAIHAGRGERYRYPWCLRIVSH
ncbi:MAG: DUF4870 domain-containing protein [Planctomycetota bacterium]